MKHSDLGVKIGTRIIHLSKRPFGWFRRPPNHGFPMSKVLALRLHLAVITAYKRVGNNPEEVVRPLCDHVASQGVALLDNADVTHLRAMLRDCNRPHNERDQGENLAFCLDERHKAYHEVAVWFGGGPESKRLIEASAYGAHVVRGDALMTIVNLFAFYCEWKGIFTADGSAMNPRVVANPAAFYNATLILASMADEVNALVPTP